ncbi:MAG: hypothetical protein J6C86_08475 [Bacteroidaceae bacterium]|nr:hypothetical protein [Bacteroidaceae bacterium]
MYFYGKAVVHDDDYVKLNETPKVSVDFYGYDLGSASVASAELYLKFQPKGFGIGGICYSTMRGVTVDNGKVVDFDPDDSSIDYNYSYDFPSGDILVFNRIHNLAIDADYYYRAFTRVEGKIYYSSEQHFSTKPSMSEMLNDSTGIVVPDVYSKGVICLTNEAWEKFCTRFPYFTTRENSKRNEILFKQWLKKGFAKVKDSEADGISDSTFVCTDGVVYYVDEVPDNFMDAFSFDEIKIDGWDYCEECGNNRIEEVTKIECDEIYGIPGNTYAVFTRGVASHPVVNYNCPNFLLSNYKYNIEFVMAPETRDGIVKKKNQFRASLRGIYPLGTHDENLVDKEGNRYFESDSLECTTVSLDVVPRDFGMYDIEMMSYFRSTERNRYTRELRIVGIRVKPVGPVEEDVQE